jgi:hypothetical protein
VIALQRDGDAEHRIVQCLRCGHAEARHQHAGEGRRHPAALKMAEQGVAHLGLRQPRPEFIDQRLGDATQVRDSAGQLLPAPRAARKRLALGHVSWADLEAYRAWTEERLTRLVPLNTRRAAEEAQGLVRWLRPDFQDPARLAQAQAQAQALAETAQATQAELISPKAATAGDASDAGDSPSNTPTPCTSRTSRQPWPDSLPLQMRAVAQSLASQASALSEAQLAEAFTGHGP